MPKSVTEAVFKLYADNPSRTEYREFEGRGHSLTIDSGWRDVADVVLAWLATQEQELVESQPGGAALTSAA